jgi:hypothetical protein
MILIISDNFDNSTNDILEWLEYYNVDFILITPFSVVKIISVNELGFIIDVDEKRLNSQSIKSFWYRRGEIILDRNEKFAETEEFIKNESDSIIEYLCYIIEKNKKIVSFKKSEINRIIALNYASSIGLIIPNYLITSNKKELLKFQEICKNGILIKNSSAGIFFISEDTMKIYLTKKINYKILNSLEDPFFPTLFLENINKVYEIRAFILNKKVYSMAIILENSDYIDIKEIKSKSEIRYTPYKLPLMIENKLLNCTEHFKLESASIDLLINSDAEYIFLEINPIGQFGKLSQLCNYYLENEIVKELIK